MTMTESSVELVPVPERNLIVAGDTPEQILENAAKIAQPLADLIERQGLYTSMGRDKRTGEERKHVEVSGWQAAGAMLGAMGGTPIHADTVWTRRQERDDDFVAYEAHVEIRTIHGEVVGAAEAMCSNEESKRRGADEYAIRSMAETRAESRAYRKAIGWIISLAGFSPTPAEEMGGQSSGGPSGGTGQGQLPEWAAPMTDIPGVAHNLVQVLQGAGISDHGKTAMEIGETVYNLCKTEQEPDGSFPFVLARLLSLMANAVESGQEKGGNAGEAEEPDVVNPEPDDVETIDGDQTNNNE